MKEHLFLLGKGAAMGAANVIPGVSGGTVAFITGIYERLINALKSFNSTAIKLLFGGKIREFVKHTDLVFLILLGVGAVLSLLTLARLLKWGFNEYPVLVWAFFFGLILASVPAVGKQIRKWGIATIVAAIIGAGIATSMAFVPQAEQSDNFLYLMLCGVVAICSMIIPGLSGSFVLLLMGNYELVMLDSINNLSENPAEAARILLPVAVGAVVGLIVLSRFLSWLFKNHHDTAVALIVGFVAGSLIIVWPWKSENVTYFPDEPEPNATEPAFKEKIIGYANWELPKLTGEPIHPPEVEPEIGKTFLRPQPQVPTHNWIALLLMVLGALMVWLMERGSPSSSREKPTET